MVFRQESCAKNSLGMFLTVIFLTRKDAIRNMEVKKRRILQVDIIA